MINSDAQHPAIAHLSHDGGLPAFGDSPVHRYGHHAGSGRGHRVFGVVYMVNMQMSFLNPPFGYALFYLKSVAPPEITMARIFRAAIPFLFLQALGLALCVLFPQLVLWLPKQVYG